MTKGYSFLDITFQIITEILMLKKSDKNVFELFFSEKQD